MKYHQSPLGTRECRAHQGNCPFEPATEHPEAELPARVNAFAPRGANRPQESDEEIRARHSAERAKRRQRARERAALLKEMNDLEATAAYRLKRANTIPLRDCEGWTGTLREGILDDPEMPQPLRDSAASGGLARVLLYGALLPVRRRDLKLIPAPFEPEPEAEAEHQGTAPKSTAKGQKRRVSKGFMDWLLDLFFGPVEATPR